MKRNHSGDVSVSRKCTRLRLSIALGFISLLQSGCTTQPPILPESSDDISELVGKEAGDVRDDAGLWLVWCPAGKFKMGSPISEIGRQENEDQVDVTLTNGFWLGQTEVTQELWENVMGTNPWSESEDIKVGATYPAANVSWDDAVQFCKKLTANAQGTGQLPRGWEYTLPTEAQWEYACRSGTTTSYSFGDDKSLLSDFAWWGALGDEGNARSEPWAHQVSLKSANTWGFHDMHGNVLEWCQDWYSTGLTGGTDPVGPAKGKLRVGRGGQFVGANWRCRSAYRDGLNPSDQYINVGFRVALSLVQRAK